MVKPYNRNFNFNHDAIFKKAMTNFQFFYLNHLIVGMALPARKSMIFLGGGAGGCRKGFKIPIGVGSLHPKLDVKFVVEEHNLIFF